MIIDVVLCKDCKRLDKDIEAEPIALTNAITTNVLIGKCELLKVYVRAEDYCSGGATAEMESE